MSVPNSPLIQSYQPTTFLDRGVAVPFTTPMLVGARARPTARCGAELIVPSPSGGRGVYILPWANIRELCRPTVHDTRLNAIVETLPGVTPSLIRQAARKVAAEGLAGHGAITAADLATRAERDATLLTNFLLLVEAVQQVEPASASLATATPTNTMQLRAKRAFAHAATRLGCGANEVAAMLGQMAPCFAPIGIGLGARKGRVGRMLAALRHLRAGMVGWSRDHADESGGQAEMVATVADLTISCAETTLQHARGMVADILSLLRNWASDPGAVQTLVARPEWLLDGWEQICLLWASTESDAVRRAVLPELVLMLPAIPQEASDWAKVPIDMDRLTRFRRTVTLNEDWRTGTAGVNLVARNERLRALAA